MVIWACAAAPLVPFIPTSLRHFLMPLHTSITTPGRKNKRDFQQKKNVCCWREEEELEKKKTIRCDKSRPPYTGEVEIWDQNRHLGGDRGRLIYPLAGQSSRQTEVIITAQRLSADCCWREEGNSFLARPGWNGTAAHRTSTNKSLTAAISEASLRALTQDRTRLFNQRGKSFHDNETSWLLICSKLELVIFFIFFLTAASLAVDSWVNQPCTANESLGSEISLVPLANHKWKALSFAHIIALNSISKSASV